MSLSKAQKVLIQIQGTEFDPSMFITSVNELLERYPELDYTEDKRGSTTIFRDAEKKVTPFGTKRLLNYKWEDLVVVMNPILAEALLLVNDTLKIFAVVGPKCSKRLFLDVLEEIYQVKLVTGGSMSAKVERIVLFFEREKHRAMVSYLPQCVCSCLTCAVGRSVQAVAEPALIAEQRPTPTFVAVTPSSSVNAAHTGNHSLLNTDLHSALDFLFDEEEPLSF